MTEYPTVARRYLEAFNAAEIEHRAGLVREVFHPEVEYTDPTASVRGHDQLIGLIGSVHEQFPGWRFELLEPVDGHGDRMRFRWALGPGGQPAPVIGFDVVVLDEAGRVRQVHGFLDRMPTAA